MRVASLVRSKHSKEKQYIGLYYLSSCVMQVVLQSFPHGTWSKSIACACREYVWKMCVAITLLLKRVTSHFKCLGYCKFNELYEYVITLLFCFTWWYQNKAKQTTKTKNFQCFGPKLRILEWGHPLKRGNALLRVLR